LKPDSENRKQLILDTACGLFAKFGFAKTTLDDVADAVGMKKGSLYYYFDSKEAIFSEVITQMATRILDMMRADIETETNPRTAILKFIESGIRHSYDAINVVGISSQMKLEIMPLAHQILSDFHSELTTHMSGIIERGIVDGEFKPCDSKRLAQAIHSVVDGAHCFALHQCSGPLFSDIPLESIVGETRYIVELILDGLRPSAAS
jgi:TetR/AcrR family transcriptional regulator